MTVARPSSNPFPSRKRTPAKPFGKALCTCSTSRAIPRRRAPMPGRRRLRAAQNGGSLPCYIRGRSNRQGTPFERRLWRSIRGRPLNAQSISVITLDAAGATLTVVGIIFAVVEPIKLGALKGPIRLDDLAFPAPRIHFSTSRMSAFMIIIGAFLLVVSAVVSRFSN